MTFDKLVYDKQYNELNRDKRLAYMKARREKFKDDVLNAYGRSCAICGFDDIRALQIDHIENDGAAERKSLGGKSVSGWRFYEILKARGYPEGYQTLCANCNNIKQWDLTH